MTQELENQTSEKTTPSPEEMADQLSQLQENNRKLAETNERILTESKNHAEKWRSYRDTANQDEIKKLEEEKNWKALLEKERGQNKLQSERMEQMRRRTLKKTLDFEVARYAGDANDVTDIINSLPADLVKIDEDNMSIEGVSDAVNKLREDKPYLFKKPATPGTVNDKPGIVGNAPGKTMSELTMDDKVNALKETLLESYT